MINNFNLKSLAFYGVAIVSVLSLFKVVTAYGESHLQAPPTIKTHYQLSLLKNLPNCQQANALILNIQQSGIYVNAGLLPIDSHPNAVKQLNFTGIFANKQLNLTGKIDQEIFCQIPHLTKGQLQPMTIEMSLVNQDHIPVQIKINHPTPQILDFTAVPQTEPEINPPLKSH